MISANPSPTPLLAGTAKVDITCQDQGRWDELLPENVKRHVPPEYLKKSIRISDPLYVRALYLDDGQKQITLVTLDVTAIGARTISQNILSDSADDFVSRVRRRAEAELNIPPAHVNLFATHTHQVPRMLCSDQEQIDRTLEAISRAKYDAQPATLLLGRGNENALTVNRTMQMKDGSDHTVRNYHTPMPPNDQVEALRPIDPEIGLLRLDRTDGSPLAALYVFGAHLLLGAPDGTTGTITADHVGVALRHIEKHLGDDAMAFALQGAVGDAIEVCQFDTDHPPTSQQFGDALAQSVLNVYRAATPAKPSPRLLDVATRTIDLQLRRDIPQAIDNLKKKQQQLIASLQYTSLSFESFLPLYLKYQLRNQHPNQWAFRYLHAESRGDTSFQALDDRNRAAINQYRQSIGHMEKLASLQEDIVTLQKHQEVIDKLDSDTIRAEINGIRIGDLYLLTSPAEMLTETVLQTKADSPFDHTHVVSLANGYLHYAPPASYYPRGGYETTECVLDASWAPTFDTTVQEILHTFQSSRQKQDSNLQPAT